MTALSAPASLDQAPSRSAPGRQLDIALTNMVTLNTGDAAILHGTIRALEQAFEGDDLRFTVRDRQAEVAARHYPGLDFQPAPYPRLRRTPRTRFAGPVLRRAARARYTVGVGAVREGRAALARRLLSEDEQADAAAYSSSDLIVSTGGTYLVESYRLEPAVADLSLARLANRPLVLYTQSLGPFIRPRNIRMLRRELHNAQLVLLRDERSRSHLEVFGLPESRMRVAADAAFALADEGAVTRAASAPAGNGPPRVAISVRDWPHFQTVDPAVGMARFREAVAGLAAHLVEDLGAEVTFVSTCQGEAEYWTDDSKVAQEVVALLPAAVRRSVEVDAHFHRPDELMELLSGQDLVVSTRMHMAILSLCAGVPVLPIAYEFKTEELFASLGVGGWVQDIETATSESLGAGLDGFLGALPELRRKLFQRVLEARDSALDAGLATKDAYERWCAAHGEGPSS